MGQKIVIVDITQTEKQNKDKDRHLLDRKKERKTEKQNKNKGRHHSDR